MIVEVRMTGSMGTLVLVVTFMLPFFVRLVLKVFFILILDSSYVQNGFYPLGTGENHQRGSTVLRNSGRCVADRSTLRRCLYP